MSAEQTAAATRAASGGGIEGISLTLTSLTLAPDARTELSDSHAVHKRVMSMFDGITDPGDRILWAAPAPATLLVQAPHAPSRVLTAIGWAAGQHTIDYGRVLAGLGAGQAVRYHLIGNPVRRHGPRRIQGVRVGNGTTTPLPAAEREDWLRAHLHGALYVRDIHGRDLGPARGRRPGGQVSHLRHLFTGNAAVIDPQALIRLVAAGVGRARGYGCGLLLITPANPGSGPR